MRDTGIKFVGNVPWGSHLCHFFGTPQDLLDTLIPYFTAGLHANELCVWITSDPLLRGHAIEALRSAAVDVDARMQRGDIAVVDYTEWYSPNKELDLDSVFERWRRTFARASSAGYNGVRLNGNHGWLCAEKWEELAQYEAHLNEFIRGQRALALCSYPVRGVGPQQFFEVARTHEFVFTTTKQRWEAMGPAELRNVWQEIAALKDFQEDCRRRVEAFRRLESNREAEASRIARELHDELGSALTTVKWQVESFGRLALGQEGRASRTARVRDNLGEILAAVECTIKKVRAIAFDLHPRILDDFGLGAAVECHAWHFQCKTGIACACEYSAEPIFLTREQSTAVFRIVQGTLAHVSRGGKATRVNVRIEQNASDFVLTVRHDGEPMEPDERHSTRTLGVSGFHERARLAGGTIDIAVDPNEGTTLTLRIPTAQSRGA